MQQPVLQGVSLWQGMPVASTRSSLSSVLASFGPPESANCVALGESPGLSEPQFLSL